MPWQVVPRGEGVFSFAVIVLPRPTQMGDNMVEILNFSRETAFGPKTIQVLAAALDEAWERLRQSGSRLASEEDISSSTVKCDSKSRPQAAISGAVWTTEQKAFADRTGVWRPIPSAYPARFCYYCPRRRPIWE
jgi:hypothetical protein